MESAEVSRELYGWLTQRELAAAGHLASAWHDDRVAAGSAGAAGGEFPVSGLGNAAQRGFGRGGKTGKSAPAELMRLPGLDKVWDQGFTGKGQTIAVIDSGFFAHPDFADRVVGYVDMSSKSKRMLDR